MIISVQASLGSASSCHLNLAEHDVPDVNDSAHDAFCTLLTNSPIIADISAVDDAERTVTALALDVVLELLVAVPSLIRSPEAVTELLGDTVAEPVLTDTADAVTADVSEPVALNSNTMTADALVELVRASVSDPSLTLVAEAAVALVIASVALPSLTISAAAVVVTEPAAVAEPRPIL